MESMIDSTWRAYLPKYHFPRFLRLSCGCVGLLLVSMGLFIFSIAPSLMGYIMTLDARPLYEMQVGETVTHADFGVQLLRIDRSSPCTGDISCATIEDTLILVFSTTLNDDILTVTYTDEMTLLALPNGYLLHVVAVTVVPPDNMQDGRIQFQLYELLPTG